MREKKLINIIIIFLIHITAISNYAQSKLSVHGYLTQAFAISDGHQVMGINKEGSTDHRNLALQFRYDINEYSNAVIQIEHRRMGESPVLQLQQDIELDWGFFEYRFYNNFSVKIGKILVPFGIYNEIRDVNILLPFYRAPYSPYGEGNYIGETLDGFNMGLRIDNFDPYIIDLNLYLGQWEWIAWEALPDLLGTGEITILTEKGYVKNVVGLQSWIEPGIDGLRLGLVIVRGDVSGGIRFEKDGALGEQSIFSTNFSLDGTFNDFYFRSEYTSISLSKNTLMTESYYLQAGYNIFDKISLNIQAENFDLHDIQLRPPYNLIAPGNSWDIEYNLDYAVGLNYSFNPNVILKAEIHYNKGFITEDEYTNDLVDPISTTKYAILSLSTCF